MKTEASTIEELVAISGDTGIEMRKLDDLIQRVAPESERQLFAGSSITMIGCGSMPWENHSGGGVWPLIGGAPQKVWR